MSLIKSLRRLVDFGQFSELKAAVQDYISETGDLFASPLLALAYAHLNETDECKSICEQIEASLDELDSDARIDLAAVYCMQQRADDALQLLESEKSMGHSTGLLFARLAWCKELKGDVNSAARLYLQSLDLESNRLTVWYSLLTLYLSNSHIEKAQSALNSAIELLERQYPQLPEQSAAMFMAQLRLVQLEIWARTDNYIQAEDWLTDRCADIEESEWCQLVIDYASLLISFEQYGFAKQLIRSSLKQFPFNLELVTQLAELLETEGRSAQSMLLFKRALKLARAQDKPEADLLARISFFSQSRMPAQESHFPGGLETLEKMEKEVRQSELKDSEKAGFLMGMASGYGQHKEFHQAFSLANEGNEIFKKQLNYNPKMHRNQCARIRNVFSKPLYANRKQCGVDSDLPVFVVGMPGSGIEVVEQIISCHSQIFGAGELDVIPGRIQEMNRWERHVGSGRNFPDCIDDISPCASENIAEGILKNLQELVKEYKPDAVRVLDCFPHNFENIGLIKFLFPNAKIISVRRDPRDIAVSSYFSNYKAKNDGMGYSFDLTWIGEQLADHNLLMHHWNQIFPDEVLEVNYEDVLKDLEGSARKMLEYIGVNWEDKVLVSDNTERRLETGWLQYRDFLSPLIKGTNAKIKAEPISDRLILPVPGFLQEGVALFHKGDLDGAEMCFKKMLHHNPGHAACQYMVGLVYCRKGYVDMAVPLFESALKTCPWNKEWRGNLIRAYEETGNKAKAAELQNQYINSHQEHIENDSEPSWTVKELLSMEM